MNTHDDHREGLSHDLPGLVRTGLGRRRVLGLLGGAGIVGLVGCTDDGVDVTMPPGTPTSASAQATGSTGSVAPTVPDVTGEIPEETAGPFPGNGSNGPDVLAESGVVREDITRSFGQASGVAVGVPLALRMRVLDLADGEATPLAGAAVYAWHCTADGRYSLYSEGVTGENFLRGVQVAGADGWLRFTTVVPGCYPGRWPHVHFEVYPGVEDARSASHRLRTSQLALPRAACEAAYAAPGYDGSAANLAELTLDGDTVFADGHSLQLARVTGSVDEGFTATLAVPV